MPSSRCSCIGITISLDRRHIEVVDPECVYHGAHPESNQETGTSSP